MARYQVVQKSFINGVFYNPEINPEKPIEIEYDGVPGPNLKPLDDAAKKAAAKFKETCAQNAKALSRAAEGVEGAAELAAA